MEERQISFTKYFFRARNEQFIPGRQHEIIDDALVRLENRKLLNAAGKPLNNLLITIPPRWGKTQIAVIDWMARCIAKNRRAKFIHLSYSDDLALDNSSKCRELVTSKEYQELWPVKIKSDSDSKKKWYTEEGGGVYATASGGPITGFGAGSLADVADEDQSEFDNFFSDDNQIVDPTLFYGAIVIDDPIKVDDAYNEKLRDHVNKRLLTTIQSRRNSRNTPIVIIMQRIHDEDMAGFVLRGGMGEEFYHVDIPALDDKGESLWPAKQTTEELLRIKAADRQVFMAQYMQNPAPEDGTFFKAEMFEGNRFRLGQEPTKLIRYGAGDYAVTEDAGDFSEQAIAGFDHKDDLWFLDWKSGQDTLDVSIQKMLDLFGDHDPVLWLAEKGTIRRAMEPFLLKEQNRKRMFFKVEWLPATASKAVNAKAFQALCAQGKVHIPYGDWGDELIEQLLKFTGFDDKHDDKVDVCGLFGRALNLTFGPSQYSDKLEDHTLNGDYGYSDNDGEDYDWRTV